MSSKKIISLYLSILSFRETLDQILFLAKNKIPSYACFANVHMVIEAFKDLSFAEQVNKADIISTDGMPLKFGLKLLYGINQERVAGMDMTPSVISECAKEGLTVGFYGSSEDILSLIHERIEKEHPKLNIGYSYSPPFKVLTIEEKDQITNDINDSGANVIFVCLGCPKQEKWIAENSKNINAILLGVGGAFALYAGEVLRAPKWMQKFYLEWCYRLFQEPKRMFKRYLTTNTLFIFLLIKEFILKNLKAN